jgi:anti-anti-sigma factor
VVAVEGSLRAPVSSDLIDDVQSLLDQRERWIVLDLARLSDIDAAGVGELVRVYTTTADAGGVLWIASAQNHVRRLLETAGVLELLSAN